MTKINVILATILFGLTTPGLEQTFASAQSTEPAASSTGSLLSGDPIKGKKIFRKCKACHGVGANAKHKVGPTLNGIIGRPVAAADDFKYSAAMSARGAEGQIWTVDSLAAFLTKPKAFLKGTKMSFAGLKKESQRANLIAYLASFD